MKSLISNKMLITCVCLLILPLGLLTSPLNASATPGSNPQATFYCTQSVEHQIQWKVSSLDTSRAISLAANSPEFKSRTSGYGLIFGNIFNTWSFSPTCTVLWKNVNVVFNLRNATGVVGNIVATEDPALTRVSNITIEDAEHYAGFNAKTPNWSGYEFLGSSSPSSVAVWESYGSWNVPSVGAPGKGTCGGDGCHFFVWVGLTHTDGGSDGYIVQAGTDSDILCGNSCGTLTYQAWYEFYPNSQQSCMNVNPGDSITSDVINHGKWGGDQHTYDLYIFDNTNSNTCSITNHYFGGMSTPYYGEFMAERVQYCNIFGCYYDTLAKFSSFSMSGCTFYSGSCVAISTTYNNGIGNNNWWIGKLMNNGCGQNIAISAVSSSTNSFSQTWQTSCGT